MTCLTLAVSAHGQLAAKQPGSSLSNFRTAMRRKRYLARDLKEFAKFPCEPLGREALGDSWSAVARADSLRGDVAEVAFGSSMISGDTLAPMTAFARSTGVG